jgi:hypothetical protein
MEFGNQNARKRVLARLLAEQHAQEIKTLVGEFLVAVDSAREAERIVRDLGSIARYSAPSAQRRRAILLEKLTAAFELWLQLTDAPHYADPRIRGIKADRFQINRRWIHGN